MDVLRRGIRCDGRRQVHACCRALDVAVGHLDRSEAEVALAKTFAACCRAEARPVAVAVLAVLRHVASFVRHACKAPPRLKVGGIGWPPAVAFVAIALPKDAVGRPARPTATKEFAAAHTASVEGDRAAGRDAPEIDLALRRRRIEEHAREDRREQASHGG